jgi:hypothetical protein
MLSGVALHLLLPDPAAARLGDSGRTLLIVGRKKLDLIPPGSKAIPVATFTSFGDLNSAISNNRLDSRIKAVLYDNEGWSLTPKYEKLRPAEFEARAAAVAHAHGYMFISTPAVNLANVLDPTPGRVFPKFLSQGIARDAARVADVFEIQAQGAQTNTQLYADFVTRAAEQARQANPHVIVLAGLSTNPNGPEVTADDLFNVVNATRSVVDGYWLNIPIPGPSCPNCRPTRPDIAIDLLHRLGI